ncbi:MAG: hypothetical protein KF799_03860 [Bdellovibrionales bacterium]|nr:hypothetical protein [Bdellovibrionales bacterium]
MSDDTLKTGLNVSSAITSFDPQAVVSTVDAHLSRNLYSRLISIDDDGQMQGELASEFSWDGKSFTFTLKPLKTIDGHSIGAEDVYYSLLRIIKNGKSTHGNLREFLCTQYDTTKPLLCDGLKISGEKIVLTPSEPAKSTFLILLLASVDMSIIPKRAMDLNSPSWDVIDHRNTSGLYYVDSADSVGSSLWKINPNHFRSSTEHFSQIQIVPTQTGPDSANAFAEGKVDFMPTSAGITVSDLKRFEMQLSVHQSHPIRLVSVAFTLKGHRHLTTADRLTVGAHIRKAVQNRKNKENGADFSQIFPLQSDGALDRENVEAYETLLSSHLAHNPPRREIKLAVGASLYDDLKDALATLPWLKVERITKLPFSRPIAEQPDVTILPGDTSFYESLTMVHYYFTMGAFGRYESGVRWINDYMKMGDKSKRLPKLRELHKALLMNGDVIPLYLSSYFAVARPPVRMDISKFFAGTPMWKVYRK